MSGGTVRITFLVGLSAAAETLKLEMWTAQVVGGQDAKAVKDVLAIEHGIMVRHYAKKELSGYIRISVGRPEHTDALIAALQRLARASATLLEKE
jgi:histidinol-phosphate aminotransferase